jgi:hypothetical protein
MTEEQPEEQSTTPISSTITSGSVDTFDPENIDDARSEYYNPNAGFETDEYSMTEIVLEKIDPDTILTYAEYDYQQEEQYIYHAGDCATQSAIQLTQGIGVEQGEQEFDDEDENEDEVWEDFCSCSCFGLCWGQRE